MSPAEQLRHYAEYAEHPVNPITSEQARALAELVDSLKGSARKDCCATCRARIAVNKAFGVEHE